jgi:PHD/YefM family antitoxin component YafN of YafNO toxin-antitoxin module
MKLHDMRFHEGTLMISLSNIHSVSDFQRNPKGILGKIKNSKSPVVLTVNGKAELIVQDAASYQELLDKVAAAEDLEAIREGLAQSFTEDGQEASEFFAELRAKHDL